MKVALFLYYSFVAMGTVVSRKTDKQSAKASPKPSEIDAQEFQRARPRRTDEKRTRALGEVEEEHLVLLEIL